MSDAIREQVNFRTTQDFLAKLDDWRRKAPQATIPTRSEAIQQLVLEAIEAHNKKRVRDRAETI